MPDKFHSLLQLLVIGRIDYKCLTNFSEIEKKLDFMGVILVFKFSAF